MARISVEQVHLVVIDDGSGEESVLVVESRERQIPLAAVTNEGLANLQAYLRSAEFKYQIGRGSARIVSFTRDTPRLRIVR